MSEQLTISIQAFWCLHALLPKLDVEVCGERSQSL